MAKVVFYYTWDIRNQRTKELRAGGAKFFIKDIASIDEEEIARACHEVEKSIYQRYYKDRIEDIKNGYELQYADNVKLQSFSIVSNS